MENLVIVESPTKADTIQKFLGKGYVVKPSRGHIRDLQEKKLSVDVENGFAPEYVVPANKKQVVTELKKLAKEAHTVWLASDEDREGEAISWHLSQVLELDRDKTRRIVFHEITKPAILAAIENPRTVDMNLVNAQQARRVLDRLVGFEVSPLLWRKIQPRLSAGRVQSVALRLVVDREREIIAFQKEQFYKIEGDFHPATLPSKVKVKATLDSKFKGIDQAAAFLEDCKDADFSIASIEKKEGVRTPAAPFTTSTLQQEASRKLHFSVSQTMKVAQQLYERGLITYMRTDSTNLSGLAISQAKKFICENYGEEYSKTRQYRTHSKGAQEAHEAIRPTYISNPTIDGSSEEKRLYTLIWKRTVASQMADAKIMRTDIRIGISSRSEKFAVQASEVLFEGFLKLYLEGSDDEEAGDDEIMLPQMNVGDAMDAKEIRALCKYTAAPSRYSEATLVKKLEELGIGRPSTYEPTIRTLTTGRGYIVKGDKPGEKIPVTNAVLKDGSITYAQAVETIGAEKGKLQPQEIGMIVTDYLVENFKDILDYNFTASVESGFDRIAEGEMEWNSLISSFYAPFHSNVQNLLGNGEYSHVSRALGTDPESGEPVVARFGQYGPYIQKGEGENRHFAKLGSGQLIESITLEEALKLFQLPRVVGNYAGIDIVATKGRFGPYLKYGDKNISLPRNSDPMNVSLEVCIKAIEDSLQKGAVNDVMAEFGEIKVINGRYGPYIKCGASNYKIPSGTDAATLDEAACKAIIESGSPTSARRGFKKKSASSKK